jgi:archaellum component FlaG (FlaF/FlaG flagellin family)
MSASRVGERGVATSLLEATLVIAITAILVTASIGAAMRYVEDARISRAIADYARHRVGACVQER